MEANILQLVGTASGMVALIIAAVSAFLQKRGSNDQANATRQLAKSIEKVLPNTSVDTGNNVSLEFLAKDIPLPEKRHKQLCYALYDSGRAQFEVAINNRNGIIEKAQREMAELGSSLSDEELAAAKKLGIAKARSPEAEIVKVAWDLGNLLAKAQLYAEHKTIKEKTLLSLARDMGKGIPITDYTEVKKRLAEGASLAQVIDDLPIPWQKIREIPWPMPYSHAKPTKPDYISVIKITEEGVSEDNKAERDGEWVVSDKLDIVYPLLDMVPHYKFINPTGPPVLAGKSLVITRDAPPEWETKLWGKGGYLDQVFLRAAKGEDPKTLRRKQLNSRIQWAFLVTGLVFFFLSLAYSLVQRYG